MASAKTAKLADILKGTVWERRTPGVFHLATMARVVDGSELRWYACNATLMPSETDTSLRDPAGTGGLCSYCLARLVDLREGEQ